MTHQGTPDRAADPGQGRRHAALLTALVLALATPAPAREQETVEERRAALQRAVNEGNEAFRTGQYGSAEVLYEQALAATDPGLPLEQVPLVNRNLAHTRYRMEQWSEAIEAYVRSDAEDVDHWLAQCHLQLGNYEQALAALQVVRVRFPARAGVREQIAQLYARLARTELAAEAYRGLLGERPADPALHRALAGQVLALGRSAEALDLLEGAWRLGARDADSARLIGDLYLQEGMRLEAAAYYTRYLNLAGEVGPEDHFRIGLAYFQGGEMATARGFFQRAVEVDAGYAVAYLYTGQAALAEGDPDAAYAEYRRALEVDATLAAAHEGIGGIELERGNHAAAVAAYREAVRLGEVDVSTHHNLVQSLLRAGERELAIQALKEALRAHPDRRELRTLLEVIKRTPVRSQDR